MTSVKEKTCSTCRHWTKEATFGDKSGRHLCMAIGDARDVPGGRAVVVPSDLRLYYGGKVYTCADFSCALHEPEPEPKP